jgi:hypothetical protein
MSARRVLIASIARAQGSQSRECKTQAGKLIRGCFVWSDVWLRRRGTGQIVQAQDVRLSVRANQRRMRHSLDWAKKVASSPFFVRLGA